jgi:hypothetical protein
VERAIAYSEREVVRIPDDKNPVDRRLPSGPCSSPGAPNPDGGSEVVEIRSIRLSHSDDDGDHYIVLIDPPGVEATVTVVETRGLQVWQRGELHDLMGRPASALVNRLVDDYHNGRPVELPAQIAGT